MPTFRDEAFYRRKRKHAKTLAKRTNSSPRFYVNLRNTQPMDRRYDPAKRTTQTNRTSRASTTAPDVQRLYRRAGSAL